MMDLNWKRNLILILKQYKDIIKLLYSTFDFKSTIPNYSLFIKSENTKKVLPNTFSMRVENNMILVFLVYIGLLLTEICRQPYFFHYPFLFIFSSLFKFGLKSEQKLVKIVHVSRQKLLQHAKACSL